MKKIIGDSWLPLFVGSIFVIIGIVFFFVWTRSGGTDLIFSSVLSGFVGGVAVFVGITDLKSNLALYRNKNIKDWICCTGTTVTVYDNNTIKTGNQNRQYIECLVQNPVTGILMTCKSDKVFKNLRAYELETVPVYINPQKPQKYYVAIQEAIEKKANK